VYHSQKLLSAFFIASRNGPEVLESIDATFDDVTAFVGLCVEFRWPTTSTPFLEARVARIFPLRTDTTDLAATQLLTELPSPVGAVNAQSRRTFAGAPRTGAPDADLIQQRDHVGGIAGLPFRDQDREWTTLALAQDVDFGVASTPADTKPLVDERPLFSRLAGCFRAPTALRWALQRVLSNDAPSQSMLP
jgi:hypothetical protein